MCNQNRKPILPKIVLMDQCPSLPSVMWPLCLGPKLPFIGSSILYFIISNAGLHRFLKTYLKCSFWGTHVCIKKFFYPQESHKSFSIVHTIFYILHRLPVYYLFPTLTQKSSKNLNQTETDNQYPSHLSNIKIHLFLLYTLGTNNITPLL